MSDQTASESNDSAEAAEASPPSPAWCHRLLAIGQTCAVLADFHGEEAEDCACEFMLHHLAPPAGGPRKALPSSASDGLLFTSAMHWAQNWARGQRRRQHRRVPWYGPDGNIALELTHLPDSAPSPETQFLQAELPERLCAVLLALTKPQRELFARVCLRQESSAAIARATNRLPDTVRSARRNLRRRVIPLLAQHGLTLQEVRDYLAILLRPP